jgi:hypothetical protein
MKVLSIINYGKNKYFNETKSGLTASPWKSRVVSEGPVSLVLDALSWAAAL